MPTFRRTTLIAKWTLGVMTLVIVAVGVQRLERGRPLEQLELAGAEVVIAPDGQSGIVKLTGPNAGDEQLALVARLSGVTIVQLSHSAVTRDGVRRLSELPNLRRLDLSHARYAAGSLESISRIGSLRSLDLSGCAWVGDEDLDSLRALNNLETLNLSGTSISDAGLARLAGLPRLSVLDLRDAASISDAGLSWLTTLSRLQQLNVSGCRSLTEVGIRDIAVMPSLDLFSASGVWISREAAREIRTAKPQLDLRIGVDFSDLRPLLDLGARVGVDAAYVVREVTIDGTRAVAPGVSGCQARWWTVEYWPEPPILSEMRLPESSAFPPQDLDKAVSALEQFDEIHSVTLRGVPLTDDGMQSIGRLDNLQFLWLADVRVSDRGLECLRRLPKLCVLTLEGTTVAGTGLADLTSLEHLALDGPLAANVLGQFGQLPQLRWLAVKISDVSLADSTGLAGSPSLQHLSLYRCNIAAGALSRLGQCRSLQALSLRECEVFDADLKELRGQRSRLNVTVSESRDGEGV